jgi:hypothetical protein
MQNQTRDLNKFSKHLFWDVDISTLSFDKHKAFIVKRIAEYGLLPDWQLLTTYMSIDEIAVVAKTLNELDSKTLSFLATITKQPRSTFKCFTTQPSINPHWNF